MASSNCFDFNLSMADLDVGVGVTSTFTLSLKCLLVDNEPVRLLSFNS